MGGLATDMVSVIVPIFNAQNFLHKCIDSILAQSYSHLNVILVDDGSQDASGEICDSYAVKDDRVFVIHKPNGGLVSARKAGVKVAKGEFVCWVDADDWVEKDFIKDFVEIQRQTQADLVAMSLYHDINDSTTIDNNGLADGEYKVTEILPKLMHAGKFYQYGIGPHLVTKMFRTDIIREAELKVDERIVAGEDAATTYVAVLKCDKIAIRNKPNYHYVQHPVTITKVSSPGELQRVEVLIDYLATAYRDCGVYDIMKRQLNIYKNYMLALRKIDSFDENCEEVLIAYGGFKKHTKIIIYGAGVIGQMIYKYVEKDAKLHVIRWLDQNHLHYNNIGYAVDSPEILDNFNEEYDYILIANISEDVYASIKDYLLTKGIPHEKIRWFSEEIRGL